jgi:hypothetical protein
VFALMFVFVLVGELVMGSVAVPDPVDAVVEGLDVDVDVVVRFVILVFITQHWMLFGPGQGQGY